MGLRSHDVGAELRMHSFSVDCDTFLDEEKFAVVVPVTSAELTGSEGILAPRFPSLLEKCLMKRL